VCGRFVSASSPALLAQRFGVEEIAVTEREPDYNVTPQALVPAVRQRRATRVLSLLRFGLVPSWAESPASGDRLINARAETAASKPAFKTALRRRRCIVPADGFYEWVAGPPPPGATRPARRPFLVRRRDGEPLALAGLWEIWRDPAVADPDAPDAWVRSCAIVTTRANDIVAPLHDRMPVVLPEACWAAWLDPALHDVTQLGAMLVPAPDDWLEAYPVRAPVNSPRNNDADLVRRVEDVA